MSDIPKQVDLSEFVDPVRALRERIERDAPDTADGAALRRLREALGGHKAWTVVRHYNYDTSDHYPVVVDAEDFDWRVRGKGHTVAEAADRCRESLERRA